MTVSELIAQLQKLPPDAKVYRLDEGEIQGETSLVCRVEYKPEVGMGWSGGVLLK